jgi:serine/threonine-protein kinase
MPSPEAAPDDLARLPGTVVADKYLVERMIGRGGMGAVFAATNTAIGKRVALKFLTREAARDPAATQRFQREAQAAGVIESEHIVHVFDAGVSPGGLPFLVMELLNGEDLRARLDREGTLPIAAALKIAREVLYALIRAHDAGIVHRDLKPDNVFLCRRDDGSFLVKIVDFGISKLTHAGASERLTYRGTLLGSAHYVSPEQAHGSDHVDQRADIYGVGVLLFEMLAGRPPHLAPSKEAVLVAICTEDAPAIDSFRSDVPEPLRDAVARALARDPDARFASATELLGALEHAEQPARRPEARRRRAALWALGALSTLLGFLLMAVLVPKNKPPPPSPAVTTDPATATTMRPPPVVPIEPIASAAPPLVVPLVTANEVSSARPPASAANAKPKSAPRPEPKPSATARRDAGVAGSLELSTRGP